MAKSRCGAQRHGRYSCVGDLLLLHPEGLRPAWIYLCIDRGVDRSSKRSLCTRTRSIPSRRTANAIDFIHRLFLDVFPAGIPDSIPEGCCPANNAARPLSLGTRPFKTHAQGSGLEFHDPRRRSGSVPGARLRAGQLPDLTTCWDPGACSNPTHQAGERGRGVALILSGPIRLYRVGCHRKGLLIACTCRERTASTDCLQTEKMGGNQCRPIDKALVGVDSRWLPLENVCFLPLEPFSPLHEPAHRP